MDGLRPVFVFMAYNGPAAWGSLVDHGFKLKRAVNYRIQVHFRFLAPALPVFFLFGRFLRS